MWRGRQVAVRVVVCTTLCILLERRRDQHSDLMEEDIALIREIHAILTVLPRDTVLYGRGADCEYAPAMEKC